MSAPTSKRSVHFQGTHPGSDLAIQDYRVRADGSAWLEIHRVTGIQDLHGGMYLYLTGCNSMFLLEAEARSLSSGFLGGLCATCWSHLRTEQAAA